MTTLALPAATIGSFHTLDPVQQAAVGYLARYSGGTLRDYTRDLAVFFGWCEEHQLPPLLAKRPQLELYTRWLEQTGWAESTISRRVGTMCGFYKYAVKDDLLLKDPTLDLDRPKIDREKQRRTYLPALDMAHWMTAARREGPVPFALGCLLGECGLRIAEACSLNIEEMTERRGWDVIRFVGKGNKYAEVPLPMPVMRAVRDVIGDRTEGPILLNERGNRMTRANASRLIKRVAASAGISTDISPHSFRRTMCTTALQMGVPLHKVQKAMRHADPKTTQLYNRADGFDDHATHLVAGFFSQLAG